MSESEERFRDMMGEAADIVYVQDEEGDRCAQEAEDALRAAFEALERRSDRLAETVATLNRQILERARAEQQLIDSRTQLRALSTRLLSVQEEEWRRIAREIHDELARP